MLTIVMLRVLTICVALTVKFAPVVRVVEEVLVYTDQEGWVLIVRGFAKVTALATLWALVVVKSSLLPMRVVSPVYADPAMVPLTVKV